MGSVHLDSVATVMTGMAPVAIRPQAAVAAAKFLSIKDLDVSKRELRTAAEPDAKRATPVEPGDVLLAARGDRPAVIEADEALFGAYPTLDVYLIRPDPLQLLPGFLVAWLSQERVAANLRSATSGVLIPRIPIALLKELPIPLPSLQRQHLIGTLAQAMRRESDLMQRLTDAHVRQREGQLAALFASKEFRIP